MLEGEEEEEEETVVKKGREETCGRGGALDRLTCLPHDALLQVRYLYVCHVKRGRRRACAEGVKGRGRVCAMTSPSYQHDHCRNCSVCPSPRSIVSLPESNVRTVLNRSDIKCLNV
jgi:hypothetical protein